MRQIEEKYRKKTSKYVFSWFWNFTSLAGFTQCRDTDTLISKGFWFILALTGWSLTSYTTYSTILSFLAYDIVTKTTFETGQVFQSNVTFPSVTICNSNRVHCGHLYDLIYKCEKVIDLISFRHLCQLYHSTFEVSIAIIFTFLEYYKL